ncbi:MAG: two-component sensor histidine kinase [Prevotellaceae bacterium]|jgi:signal transduction histidine kinase|nr:two-component sensor histidine kinase [Prevotellaceae bacterium]
MMKINYRQKLLLYFVAVFTLFTFVVVFFEQSREKKQKTETLEEKLDVYASIVNKTLTDSENDIQKSVRLLLPLFPDNIRLTLIKIDGSVLWDNVINDVSLMENHAGRPEIASACENGKGVDIRTSPSNEKEYLYYAVRFNDRYVRVALPYDFHVRSFLQSDNIFIYCVIALFAVVLALFNHITNRLGRSIKQLRDFIQSVENDNPGSELKVDFPKDEFGEIGTKIAENYLCLKKSQKAVTLEREKLMQHVLSSEEGLCFYSANRMVEFHNGLFIQYLNIIIDDAKNDFSTVFSDPSFEKITSFLFGDEAPQSNYFETHINRQGKSFAIRVNVFDDKSFEIIINDITRHEKTRLLKQEMTENITHELRTPVTGIRGCLETVLAHNMNPEKKQHFIENAYKQVLALSELIQDMSLITKIDAAPQSFRIENVNIAALLENLKNDMALQFKEKNIKITSTIKENVTVKGNAILIYSIFRNLTDNVIRHAGNNVKIQIGKYGEDKDFYYFSYSDTGAGISDEHHLNRLFERFYRVDEGRTRDNGGSGLGLSIVKNAVTLHRGTISVKNRVKGGLEFLFNLPKNASS